MRILLCFCYNFYPPTHKHKHTPQKKNPFQKMFRLVQARKLFIIFQLNVCFLKSRMKRKSNLKKILNEELKLKLCMRV